MPITSHFASLSWQELNRKQVDRSRPLSAYKQEIIMCFNKEFDKKRQIEGKTIDQRPRTAKWHR
jgi:hypothetical protein